ncbi:hypothetical protein B0H13DRAFT_1898323 [Mycena leptocephala]|nr:hypothetical protein B0H13DRAFT_1898323 [Mycena leptocephala]
MRGTNTIELIFRRRAARYTGMGYSRNVSPSRCLLDWHERCQSTKRLETGEGCMSEVRVPPLQDGIPGKPTIRNARKYHAPYNDIEARNPRMKRYERVQDTKSARIGEAALSVRREGMYSKWMEEWVVKGLNTRSRVGGTETQLIQSQNHCLLRKSDLPRLGGYDASRADLGWLEKRKLQNLRNGHSPVKDRGGQYFEVSVRLRLEDSESVATKSKKMNPNPRLPELEAKAKAFGLRG